LIKLSYWIQCIRQKTTQIAYTYWGKTLNTKDRRKKLVIQKGISLKVV
jgi:hypothetical protein